MALALSDNEVAMLQGPALALSMTLGAVPIGLLVDRYSRVSLLLIFAFCNIAGTLGTAFAPDYAVLFAARCLVGLAVNATSVVVFALLADMYAPAVRGRANTIVVIFQFAGMAAAFALGGVVAASYGDDPAGWRWALAWLTVPLFPLALLIIPMRDPPRAAAGSSRSPGRQAFAELWRHRRLIGPLLIGLIMIEMIIGAALVWALPALTRNFALSPDRAGVIMSVAVLASGVLGSISGGLLADLCQRTGGPRRTLSLLSLLALLNVPMSLFAVVSGLALASVLLFGALSLFSAIAVQAIVLLTIVTPAGVRGLCLSIMVGANTLFGIALAPLAVSGLSVVLGGTTQVGLSLTLVCGSASLLAAVLFAVGTRAFQRM